MRNMVRMEGTNMKRYAPFAYMVAAVVVIGMAVFGCLDDYEQTVEGLRPLPAAEPVETVPRTTVPTTKTLPIPVTTTARVVWVDTVPSEARCPEWWHLLRAFWPSGLHMDADRVMWAETRCQNLHRSSSGGIGYGDHGLFQINAVNLEYLAQYGITAADLMVPAQNVVAALILYKNAETMHGCGWQPWYSSVDYRAMCDAQQDR